MKITLLTQLLYIPYVISQFKLWKEQDLPKISKIFKLPIFYWFHLCPNLAKKPWYTVLYQYLVFYFCRHQNLGGRRQRTAETEWPRFHRGGVHLPRGTSHLPTDSISASEPDQILQNQTGIDLHLYISPSFWLTSSAAEPDEILNKAGTNLFCPRFWKFFTQISTCTNTCIIISLR